MENKIIVRIAEGLGNQFFMYAQNSLYPKRLIIIYMLMIKVVL